MPNNNESQIFKLLQDYVKLSYLIACPNCKKETKLLGEPRKNGNWWCPFCLSYFPYKDNPKIEVDVPFIRLSTELQNEPQPLSSPLGVASVSFPMDVPTGFLVPSYSYRIRRKRNVLLAQAIDFTRFGRIKSGSIWQFDLVWNGRSLSEFETLISFADTQGYHIPFIYVDPVRGSTHECYFDSDVEGEPTEFDGISFSVRISE